MNNLLVGGGEAWGHRLIYHRKIMQAEMRKNLRRLAFLAEERHVQFKQEFIQDRKQKIEVNHIKMAKEKESIKIKRAEKKRSLFVLDMGFQKERERRATEKAERKRMAKLKREKMDAITTRSRREWLIEMNDKCMMWQQSPEELKYSQFRLFDKTLLTRLPTNRNYVLDRHTSPTNETEEFDSNGKKIDYSILLSNLKKELNIVDTTSSTSTTSTTTTSSTLESSSNDQTSTDDTITATSATGEDQPLDPLMIDQINSIVDGEFENLKQEYGLEEADDSEEQQEQQMQQWIDQELAEMEREQEEEEDDDDSADFGKEIDNLQDVDNQVDEMDVDPQSIESIIQKIDHDMESMDNEIDENDELAPDDTKKDIARLRLDDIEMDPGIKIRDKKDNASSSLELEQQGEDGEDDEVAGLQANSTSLAFDMDDHIADEYELDNDEDDQDDEYLFDEDEEDDYLDDIQLDAAADKELESTGNKQLKRALQDKFDTNKLSLEDIEREANIDENDHENQDFPLDQRKDINEFGEIDQQQRDNKLNQEIDIEDLKDQEAWEEFQVALEGEIDITDSKQINKRLVEWSIAKNKLKNPYQLSLEDLDMARDSVTIDALENGQVEHSEDYDDLDAELQIEADDGIDDDLEVEDIIDDGADHDGIAKRQKDGQDEDDQLEMDKLMKELDQVDQIVEQEGSQTGVALTAPAKQQKISMLEGEENVDQDDLLIEDEFQDFDKDERDVASAYWLREQELAENLIKQQGDRATEAELILNSIDYSNPLLQSIDPLNQFSEEIVDDDDDELDNQQSINSQSTTVDDIDIDELEMKELEKKFIQELTTLPSRQSLDILSNNISNKDVLNAAKKVQEDKLVQSILEKNRGKDLLIKSQLNQIDDK